jgi:hypothetical protein
MPAGCWRSDKVPAQPVVHVKEFQSLNTQCPTLNIQPTKDRNELVHWKFRVLYDENVKLYGRAVSLSTIRIFRNFIERASVFDFKPVFVYNLKGCQIVAGGRSIA